MDKIDDGGPAFPQPDRCDDPLMIFKDGDVRLAGSGMSLRDYFAIHGPEPTEGDIADVQQLEHLANPHNDSYKPVRRSRAEIRAALRYQYANEMLKARKL